MSPAQWLSFCHHQGGNNLPYFHDSNVIIGYYFHVADVWGKSATIVLEDSKQNYTGTFVWAECFGIENGGKCKTIKNKIVREFRRAIAALKRNPSVSSLNTQAITEKWRIADIIFGICGDSGDDPAVVSKVISELKDDYENECLNRFSRLSDRNFIKLHRRRTDYPELYDGLTGFIDDPDDIEVLLDAHDLALSVPEIVFWTGDKAHIAINREIIVNLTDISDVRYLREKVDL